MAEGNADLRARRTDPGVLGVGDAVHVPDAEPFEFYGLAVGRRHQLVVELPYPTFRVELAYANEAPVVGPSIGVELAAEGQVSNLEPDDQGRIEFEVGPGTEEVTLRVLGRELRCGLAQLQPVDTFAGIHDRLANLGYEPGGRRGRRSQDRVAFLSAVQEFQCDHGLRVDGDPGSDTRAKLLDLCGA